VNGWKIICATLVIFITGIITGASLVRFAERGPKPWQRVPKSGDGFPSATNTSHSNNPAPPNDPRPASTAGSGALLFNREFVQVLARQLRLTSEQRERVDQIMAEGQERMRELRASLEPQTRKQMLETRDQIHALLTPAQREQFEELMKKRSTRRSDGPTQPQRERRLHDQPKSIPPHDAPSGGVPSAPASPRNPASPMP